MPQNTSWFEIGYKDGENGVYWDRSWINMDQEKKDYYDGRNKAKKEIYDREKSKQGSSNDFVVAQLVKIATLLIEADELSPKQKEYREHFNDTMEKHDIESPAELNEEEAKDFFNDVDDGWDAKDE
jgi:hypothetical protein